MKRLFISILSLWLLSISIVAYAEPSDIPEYISWEQIVSGGIGTYESKNGITHVTRNKTSITVSGGTICDLNLSGTDFPDVMEFTFDNLAIIGTQGSGTNSTEATIRANSGEVFRVLLSDVTSDVDYFTCRAEEGKLVIENNNDRKRLTAAACNGGEIELINKGNIKTLWIDAMFDSLAKVKNEGNCDEIDIWGDEGGRISGVNDGDAGLLDVNVYGNCKTDWINNGDIEELSLLHGNASETNLVLNGNLNINNPNQFDDTYTAIADIHDDSMIHIWGNGSVYRDGIHNDGAPIRTVVVLNDKQYAKGADTEPEALALIKKNFMMDLSMIMSVNDDAYVDAVVWYDDLSGNSQEHIFSLKASQINKPIADQSQKEPSYGYYPCFNVTGKEQTLNPTPTPTLTPTVTPTPTPTATPNIGDIIGGEDDFGNLPPVDVPTLILPDGVVMDASAILQYDKPNANKKNTVVYNVHLINQNGEALDLPAGAILCFPYPEGLDENSGNKYRIIIHHYADNGSTEVFKSENGDIEFTKQGLCIRVSSFSPFEITWEEQPEVDLPQTGDNSHIVLWTALLTLAGTAMLTLKRKTA